MSFLISVQIDLKAVKNLQEKGFNGTSKQQEVMYESIIFKQILQLYLFFSFFFFFFILNRRFKGDPKP